MVTIERIDGTYYKTTLDFTKGSHFEVGQAYAQEIVNTLPSYGATIDLFLLLSSEASPEQPAFATLITRAYDLIAGMPQDYKDELAGMTTVFTYPIDKLGDGMLSTNELLVFEVLHDVVDPGICPGKRPGAPRGQGAANRRLPFARRRYVGNFQYGRCREFLYPTCQSYTLDMGSLELVANFGSTEGNPPYPTYTRVFASNPFL